MGRLRFCEMPNMQLDLNDQVVKGSPPVSESGEMEMSEDVMSTGVDARPDFE